MNAHENMGDEKSGKTNEDDFAKIRRRPSENSPPLTSPSARLLTAENSQSESSTETSPPGGRAGNLQIVLAQMATVSQR